MTLVLATVHFEVMCEKICAIAVKIRLRIHEDRQGLTSNGLEPNPFSISCYVMPIRVIWLMVDTFGAGCCSRIQSNFVFLNSLARVVNAHALTPHCIPQVMLATFN